MSDRAVMLVNLGSPDTPSVPDVRRYLNEFLMDERVVDLPWALRRFLVSVIILPRRPKASAEAYESIWTPEGSPLKVTTEILATALDKALPIPVRWAMRYGSPSIETVLRELAETGIKTLRYVPLYPHWAMSTTETSVVEAERVLAKLGHPFELEVQPPFYDDPEYIDALAETARAHLQPDDHLLFSYHGLPERQVRKCDPTGNHCLKTPNCCEVPSPAHGTCYRHQVYETSKLLAQALGLGADRWEVAFQSRLGGAKWIEPYTDEVLEALPKRGIKKLAVMCPAFVADNLETLEEIGMQGRETFEAAGGERYTLIPCLNAQQSWVESLARWCLDAEPRRMRTHADGS